MTLPVRRLVSATISLAVALLSLAGSAAVAQPVRPHFEVPAGAHLQTAGGTLTEFAFNSRAGMLRIKNGSEESLYLFSERMTINGKPWYGYPTRGYGHAQVPVGMTLGKTVVRVTYWIDASLDRIAKEVVVVRP